MSRAALERAGYKIVSRSDFALAGDVPAETRTIANRMFARWGGAFIVYHPESDYLLVDDDVELLIRETSDTELPKQTSLF